MSQSITVSNQNALGKGDERTLSCHGESNLGAGCLGSQSRKRVEQLQGNNLDTLAMRAVEVRGVKGGARLGQVVAFLIELADKEVADCGLDE